MQEVQSSQPKEKPQTELLAKLFSNFPAPPKIMGDKYVLGSKNFTKIIMFAIETGLINSDIDYWCHQSPKRQETETYESYKQRMKFVHFLDKYRPFLYDYSVYNTEKKHSTKRARKVMKQLGIF